MSRAVESLGLLLVGAVLGGFAVLIWPGAAREALETRGPPEGPPPWLAEARIAAHETAAVATLRNVISAQAQFRWSAKADTDEDGEGEYGGFLELSGAAEGRMHAPLVPAVLSGAFRALRGDGAVVRDGYVYRVFLPAPSGAGVGEPLAGFRDDRTLDADLAERHWCLYGWPVEHGATGRRVFFTNEVGAVLWTEEPDWSGHGNGPPPDAAFTEPGTVLAPVAREATGAHGHRWQIVE